MTIEVMRIECRGKWVELKLTPEKMALPFHQFMEEFGDPLVYALLTQLRPEQTPGQRFDELIAQSLHG